MTLLVPSGWGETKFPCGFRFNPTDDELVYYYLQRKVDSALPDDVVVKALDNANGLYADDPWKIFNKDLVGYFYVFTKLKIKSKAKIDRKAGCGTWKGQSTKRFRDSEGNVLYFKKYFVFEENKKGQDSFCSSKKNQNGHWIMCEYSLKNQGFDGNYVLCRISNKYATEKEETKYYVLPNNHEKKRKLSSYSEEEDQNSNKRRICRGNNSLVNEKELAAEQRDYQFVMAESVPPLHEPEFSQSEQRDYSTTTLSGSQLLVAEQASSDLFYCTDFASLPTLEYGVSVSAAAEGEVNYNSSVLSQSEPFSITPLFSDLDAQTTSSIEAALAKFLWPEQDSSIVPTTTAAADAATGPSYPSGER